MSDMDHTPYRESITRFSPHDPNAQSPLDRPYPTTLYRLSPTEHLTAAEARALVERGIARGWLRRPVRDFGTILEELVERTPGVRRRRMGRRLDWGGGL